MYFRVMGSYLQSSLEHFDSGLVFIEVVTAGPDVGQGNNALGIKSEYFLEISDSFCR